MFEYNVTAMWVVGITVIILGLVAIYAAHKGWLK